MTLPFIRRASICALSAAAVCVSLTGCSIESHPSAAEPAAAAALSALRGGAPLDGLVCNPELADDFTKSAATWALPDDESVSRVEHAGVGRYVVWFDNFSVTVGDRAVEAGTRETPAEDSDDLCVVAIGQ